MPALRLGMPHAVVEILDEDAFEVEFADDAGRTCASLALPFDQLWVLHHRPVKVA